MITKQKVLETVKAIPEEAFTHLDVIFEELFLLDEREKELDKMRNSKINPDNNIVINRK